MNDLSFELSSGKPSPRYSFRPARAEDVKFCCRGLAACKDPQCLPIDLPKTREELERFVSSVLDSGNGLFIAESAELGPVSALYHLPDTGLLIVLDAEMRGRGLATGVLREFTRVTRRDGETSSLWARIPRENTAAIRSFSRAGFRFTKAEIHRQRYCQTYGVRPSGAPPHAGN